MKQFFFIALFIGVLFGNVNAQNKKDTISPATIIIN
jgi:hypothetical protein